MTPREFYPEIEPYNSFHLDTGSMHRVYVEEAGSPQGIPVIFLHGGPGSGCNPNHRRYFNPDKYRIIIFDQRGCNRSEPRGEVTDNTTQHLLQDMENMRQRLDIDQWLLFGGSWGACLALLYAEVHGQHVSGMILRGTFLARQQDLDWFIKSGVNRFLPEAWERLKAAMPASQQEDLISAYHAALHGEDADVRVKAAKTWSEWCTRIVTWNFTGSGNDQSGNNGSGVDEDKIVDEVSIETHYALNRYFIENNQIMKNINRVPPVPVHLVHGQLDITCLPEASWLVSRAITGASLEIVPGAGHLAMEPRMIDALVRATDDFAERHA